MPPLEPDPHHAAAQLLQQVATGNQAALAQLYDLFASTLLGVLVSVLRNQEEAQDALQDVFVSVWQRAQQYDPALGKPVSWLVTIARNRAYDRARSLGRKAELRKATEEDLSQRTIDQLRQQWNPRLQPDHAGKISQALATLPSDQKEAIEFAFLEGFTQQEIAERLATPLGTIKARIRRGLLRLREQLTAFRDELG